HAANGRIHRYGLVRGVDELLHAIRAKLICDNKICVDHPDDHRSIIVTAGSNMGFVNAVLAIADIDDEIVLLSPYYFNHEMAIEIAGCRPVVVATTDDYQLDLSAIESAITDRTRAVVTVSPGNPTGAVFSREALTAVNQLCQLRGIYHISDEAYEYFVYSDRGHFSPASLPHSVPHTISLFSLSKAYGMAGWRIGYMVVPSALEHSVKKIQDTNLVCPPMISQIAAHAALSVGGDWCRQQIAPFRTVRDCVLEHLAALGDRCRVPQPDGAFYVLVQLDTDQRDLELVERLVKQYGVAVMPGSMFGKTPGCRLRIAYGALNDTTVTEGMGRLVHGLSQLV
ncbi:MAG: aminotransferase class I/II-fold pyridoxal phosphate-dependent enzyme, partial [Planctomycetales bacterium]|nr:aminotransferase class I/II-fold pyridoxal phosphate-dependent enzyme [Planctomycetales bacterium]